MEAVNDGGIFRLLLKPCAALAFEPALESATAEHQKQARERSLALEDPWLLMGSRRAFDQALVRVHSHALRRRRGYGLIMLDVDYFKRYNDSRGHIAGDHVLPEVAHAVREGCRTSDEVFRYGGEELVLLPDTDGAGGRVAAERQPPGYPRVGH